MSKKYNCDLLVLSPIHIGSGEKYNASEYVESTARSNKGNKLKIVKRMNISKYFISLNDELKDDFLRDLSNGNFNLAKFDEKISNDYLLYKSINRSKKEFLPSSEISECIKTFNQAYIPGSSVKGAIKSAILYNKITDEDVTNLSRDVVSNGKVNGWEYNKFLEKIFSSKFTRQAAQGDVMKFLQVSDSSSIKTPIIYDIITVMASFRILTHEFYRRNKGSNAPTLSYLETIPRGSKLTLEIKNNYDSVVFDELRLGSRVNFIDIENIKKAMFNFSRDLINHEIEFARDYDIKTLVKFYKDLSKRNTLDKPLLKVGSGSGFLATTIGLKIKKYDEFLYEQIREKLRSKTYSYAFPKSRKITTVGGHPLGWIQFSFKEVE